jgi:glycosyltransferase involved in cell wall biosynthesis
MKYLASATLICMVIIDVIIPAYNEEPSIGLVVGDAVKLPVRLVVVANNASTDATRRVAERAGAMVVDEGRKGYGYACLCAMDRLAEQQVPPDIVVFMDGDRSDDLNDFASLIQPIVKNGADLVIGSRELGIRQRGSMTVPQIFGNKLATTLIRWIYGHRFTDLGPFRAIRYSSLLALKMQDKTYGWTVEMQVKALRQKMSCTEVPVNYNKRIGKSKVSGTVKGTILAGYKIITTIVKYAFFNNNH